MEETLDLTQSAESAHAAELTAPAEPHGTPGVVREIPYSPARQTDRVRLIVTVSVLAMLGFLVVFAAVQSRSWKDHWNQTKEMLQILLPAITGLAGSVTGFYFGAQVKADKDGSGDG